MYSMPALYGSEERLKRVSVEAIKNCEDECDATLGRSCDEDVDELCKLVMDETIWNFQLIRETFVICIYS